MKLCPTCLNALDEVKGKYYCDHCRCEYVSRGDLMSMSWNIRISHQACVFRKEKLHWEGHQSRIACGHGDYNGPGEYPDTVCRNRFCPIKVK